MPGSGLEFMTGPSGGPQPWRGIEYPGEVVSGDVWASDVDALPDALDDRVVDFLKTLLTAG